MRRKIIPYQPHLKELARSLRNNSTPAEIALWQKLKRKQIHGYDFHRQKPIDAFIVDFFCHELILFIEVDGYSNNIGKVHDNDLKKETRLKSLGLTVLRFTDKQVFQDMDNVIRAIQDHIEKVEEHTPDPSQEGR